MDNTHDFDFPEAHSQIRQGIRHFTIPFTRYFLPNIGFCGCILLALFLGFSLYSYDPTDISLNTVPTFNQTRNWMHQIGAYSSDLLIQLWGYASYVWVGLMAFWAVLIRYNLGFPYGKKRILWGFSSVICASVFFAILTPASYLPTGSGGIFGIFFSNLAQTNITELDIAQCVISLLLSVIFFHLATASSWVALRYSIKSLFSPQQLKAKSMRKVSPKPNSNILDHILASDHFIESHEQQQDFTRNENTLDVANLLSAKSELPSDETAQDRVLVLDSPHLSATDALSSTHFSFMQDEDNLIKSTKNAPTYDDYSMGSVGENKAKPLRLQTIIASPAYQAAEAETKHCESMPTQPQFDDESSVPNFAHQIDSGTETMSREQLSILPPLSLLQDTDILIDPVSDAEIQGTAQALENVLRNFKIKGQIEGVETGPIITLYEFEPAPGIKTSQIVVLADDIARAMSADSVRIAPVSGKSVIGIEMPNYENNMVGLKEIIKSRAFKNHTGILPIILGKDIGGKEVIADLAKMPHLLMAGTTGSGKSVGVNAMIISLLYRYPPEQCRMIMIDPKMLELSIYNDIPHLLTPVITEPKRAIVALKWAVREMERRYKMMAHINARNIINYNEKISAPVKEFDHSDYETLPYIVVIIDEMADLMLVAGKEIEVLLQRLAQMARAAGIHLITATQRPSVDVITGTIKANFPTRISYQVTSKFDSRTILGEQGAENLLGNGDMLYMPSGSKMQRVHGPFTSEQEVEAVCNFLKNQRQADYIPGLTDEQPVDDSTNMLTGGDHSGDELYQKAVTLVMREQKASTSFIQRQLQIGYNRAARIIEQMEAEELISGANHVGKREVLIANV